VELREVYCYDAKTVVDYLIRFKKASGVSYREMARDIGCSYAYLHDVMSGVLPPADKIAEYLCLEKKTVFVVKKEI